MSEGIRRKPSVLLLEDNPGDVNLIRLALKRAGVECELMVLDDGGEALSFIRREGPHAEAVKPDLAILDLNVPKNDGLEILEAMRASEFFADVPVAILSSSSSPTDRAHVERFRILRFITKPPDLEEFLQIGDVIKGMLGAQ